MTAPRKPRGGISRSDAGAADEGRLTAVPEATRGGEDVRRRGWFWHWNALVTQYAPLIGLKGVGLLNSYTVWTDRREESPHRGYAFPSQQSEADFYGEDRAELITINKILVALDLIEIRKEMVLRADAQGRRWKVPHNFYRVKDHGDDFTLSTPDVLRVAELAARERAVYRYVRRVFSPRFAPIDADNIWGRILEDVRRTPVWQELAARAAAEEDRASARTRAGHAARKGSSPAKKDSGKTDAAAPFFAPSDGDEAAMATADFDSDSGASDAADTPSVAAINTGLTVDVGGTNRGSRRKTRSAVGPANEGRATAVAPANTTYHQSRTTTRGDSSSECEMTGDGGTVVSDTRRTGRGAGVTTGGPGIRPPADAVGEAAALRAFESANDRAATPAERKLLRDLAARLEPVAAARRQERPGEELPGSGWGWLEAAVWEAVEAGSAFVAPRRLREILLRWEREGFPAATDDSPRPDPPGGGPPSRPRRRAPAAASAPELPPLPLPPLFAIDEVGLSNRQVWAAALAEIERRGEVGRADLETWLRPAGLSGRDGETLLVGAPNAVARDRIVARLLPALAAALAATIGVDLPVAVVIDDEVGE
ncbi:MAG: hypothetical protein IT338_16410, partial [Thermomicrobiales bacterium]|nr:hypothetical protein [Thermomicrobiales bacterium]